jgi:hypothetical protein
VGSFGVNIENSAYLDESVLILFYESEAICDDIE